MFHIIFTGVAYFCTQLFQLLLYFTKHPDHNVATASLESLQQLLRSPPPQLLEVLMTKGSIKKSLIFQADLEENKGFRAESKVIFSF